MDSVSHTVDNRGKSSSMASMCVDSNKIHLASLSVLPGLNTSKNFEKEEMVNIYRREEQFRRLQKLSDTGCIPRSQRPLLKQHVHELIHVGDSCPLKWNDMKEKRDQQYAREEAREKRAQMMQSMGRLVINTEKNNLRKVLTARSRAVEAVHWRNKQHRFHIKNLKELEKSFRAEEDIFDERSRSDADADNAKTEYQNSNKRNPLSHCETSSSSSNMMMMNPHPLAQSNEYGSFAAAKARPPIDANHPQGAIYSSILRLKSQTNTVYERRGYEKIKEKENASKFGKTESDSQYSHPSVSDNFKVNKLNIRSDIHRNLMKGRGKNSHHLSLEDSKNEVKVSNNNNQPCVLIENSRPNKVYRHPPITDDEIDDMSSEDFN